MKNFLLLVALILSFVFDANADETSAVICKIVNYTHSLGGPMITIVIIGAALLAIFGRMPWPALFALGAFTAVFFGAPAIVKAITGQAACTSNNCPSGKAWDSNQSKCV
ncbi:TrbC/VIRB2 family protein [Wolbachia endosymbiont of Armadillidium vulgare str. wVulC]|uniref:TrbC/VirB2 family protein n=1 Tax=Wolbachia endosymbiont of Armadillidium arcangelii TaxID=3158571 RepID=A0AAU7Q332_9RICK|nr:TrbC/VirB2 family protein [Wolbachia endosymbiont of Armadillidium vulgare]KLT23288.1 TrbC/VIRB2 family protein [Wolbachia endosymbiont of Armadillidium vulgare str. wVulC]OJH30548.1 TrbC/VIRB2 family protein [Armadillidium vulgare] [Wolbachia endosymbiont of Armadillidium vulgare]OJH30869.1 TrbC/VIRB2 family protein [Wolbachia endosymbiont of Armadillidium vulgare]